MQDPTPSERFLPASSLSTALLVRRPSLLLGGQDGPCVHTRLGSDFHSSFVVDVPPPRFAVVLVADLGIFIPVHHHMLHRGRADPVRVLLVHHGRWSSGERSFVR